MLTKSAHAIVASVVRNRRRAGDRVRVTCATINTPSSYETGNNRTSSQWYQWYQRDTSTLNTIPAQYKHGVYLVRTRCQVYFIYTSIPLLIQVVLIVRK